MSLPDTTNTPNVPLQSPLAIVGAFIFLVRERFKPDFGLPWKWLDSKTDTDILIEAQYEENIEASDMRPGIYIDKDQTSYGKVTIGYRDQNQPGILPYRQEQFYSIAQTDIVMDCVSPKKGESAQIASIVQQFLHMSSRVFMSVFTFRDITPIVMNRTSVYDRQGPAFNTSLNFRIEYEVRWATIPIAPILRSLGTHLSTDTQAGPDTLLSNVYTKSLAKP